eukprot:8754734-Pyramimonas_sp.AAC.2
MNATVQAVVEYGVQATDPQEVFGVIRKECTHGPNCTTCKPGEHRARLNCLINLIRVVRTVRTVRTVHTPFTPLCLLLFAVSVSA